MPTGMAIQLELTNRSDHPTEKLREVAEHRLEHVAVLHPRATHCRVVVEKPHAHAHSGNPYEVVVTLSMPATNELVVREQPGKHPMHEPVESVLRHAFQALEKRIKHTVGRQRHEIKQHDESIAVVEDLPNFEGKMGRLRSQEMGDIPFGYRAVVNGELDRLSVGSIVRYDTAADEEGFRATTVKLVDKPGVRHDHA